MTDDSREDALNGVRWLPATGGRVTGWLGFVVAVVLAVLTLWSLPVPWLGIAAVIAWLSWSAMLRPRIGLTADHLVLRGIVSTTRIPLGRIRKVAIQQVFAVWVGEQRYVSAAVGRSRRQILRPRKAARGDMHAADAIEDSVRAAMRDTVGSADPVTRTWARLEIALGVAALVLIVVTALV